MGSISFVTEPLEIINPNVRNSAIRCFLILLLFLITICSYFGSEVCTSKA